MSEIFGVVLNSHTYSPAGYCIYCGSTDGPLTDEHIVPFSLSGKLVLPKASCTVCQKTTCEMTNEVARSMYGRLRVRLNAPTRKPSKRPEKFPLEVKDQLGNKRTVMIPARLWPRSYPVLLLTEPAILSGNAPSTFQVQIRDHKEDIDDLYHRGYVRPGESVLFSAMMNAATFCRQLAQIAHAHAVSLIGSDLYQDFLVPIIMNQLDDPKTHFMFIGEAGDGRQLNSALSLDLIERRGSYFVSCRFSMPKLGWMFPTYQIICGIIPDMDCYDKIFARTAVLRKKWMRIINPRLIRSGGLLLVI
jgi:hypothetical protein